jgi:formylglycine-generating enzyme required for sulfatase activity
MSVLFSLWLSHSVSFAAGFVPPPAGTLYTSPTGARLRLIPAGTFDQGCAPGADCESASSPAVPVTLRNPLWMMEREVTQEQYQRLMKDNPSAFRRCGGDCPVEQVTWTDAARYANRLSESEGLAACYVELDGRITWESGPACAGYRLPTEAEWEWAARAGADAASSAELVGFMRGWFIENSEKQPQAVAGKAPNAWGLRDMVGNVSEWVWDGYAAYVPDPVTDPTGRGAGGFRVTRGGSWTSSRGKTTVFTRVGADIGTRNYDLGFRLVRTCTGPTDPLSM